ncbi:hypothetical protein SLEP1_g34417 [Rubroshorea leprosula]|uniref:Uncharacterized protein n=1 Tax=Rubroshorea leprosula TaxID=152421 RepID=A0AAV5KK21_9ROSI|nr:hypothetical protein SLEP1_g34417 [Rubroshorea leprosula]
MAARAPVDNQPCLQQGKSSGPRTTKTSIPTFEDEAFEFESILGGN